MTHTWKLQAFDHHGNIIGTIAKEPGGPIHLDGTPDAFACCIPDIAKLPRFLADPQIGAIDELAGQLYEEFVRQYKFTSECPLTWEALKRSANHTKIPGRWIAIATRIINTPASAN